MPRPFFQEEFTFTNPDGSRFQVVGSGNQHYAVFETLDGYTVIKNQQDGYYEYADLSADKTDLVPSGIRIGTLNVRSPQLVQHLRPSAGTAKIKALQAIGQLKGQPRWKIRREYRRNEIRRALMAGASSAPPASGTTGNYVGLCLLIQFPDVTGTIAQDEVSNFCNQRGYSNNDNNGSVHDYFYDNSDGKLHYTNTVTAYYTAKHERSYYTDNSISYGSRARELIVEGLDWLKSQGFDFSHLSSDSGGYIYALNVFYAGDRVNNWAEGLWPHSWTLAAPYEVSAGKRLSDYQITNMGNQLRLGTFCHENGHMICDFPDLYDYGYESTGVGHYCLMCYGGADNNPTQVCAYLKRKAGWTSRLTQITGCMTAGISAGKNDFHFYPNPKNVAEYFIIENRQQTGRDASLPDAGLAIWHVDELGSNNNEQMIPGQHYECSLEQADGRNDLEHGANAGDGEDLYEAILHATFNDVTTPSSKWWDGTDSGLMIGEISDAGSIMTFSTAGEGEENSIVGTWHSVCVDWGCTGRVLKASPFTFCANGNWTYAYGGGRWIQVGNMVAWNFDNAPGLIYTANVNVNAMNGIMGYAKAGLNLKGCFYALRQFPSVVRANLADELVDIPSDVVVGPA